MTAPKTSTPNAMHAQVLAWSEAEFQAHVVQAAEATGWRWYHTHDSRRSPAGYPDLFLARGGSRPGVLWVELKTMRGRVSAAQQEWLDLLAAAGQTAHVWRPSDWVDRTVHSVLAGGA